MSVSRGCCVVERLPGQWYCVVALHEYDYDFKESAIYGPQPTSDEAFAAMKSRASNPGGLEIIPYTELTPYETNLVDKALTRKGK